MYQEGCAPPPDYVHPFNELSKRDPLVAVAIELAEQSGHNKANARHAHHRASELESQLEDTESALRSERRDAVYLRNNLESANSTIRSLERKIPKKKVTKKGKK